MEWLTKLLGGAKDVANSGAFETAEKVGFFGQFLVDGAGKYESAMNGTKAAANGDWKGAFSGIAGFLAKRAHEGSNPEGGFWNRLKGNLIGEVIEWAVKSLGIVGILAVLAIGFLFKPVRDMIGGMFGFGGNKDAEVSKTDTPTLNTNLDLGKNKGVSQEAEINAAVKKNAAELTRLGYQVNATGTVKSVDGRDVSPVAALNHLIQEKQAGASVGVPS